MHAGRKVFLLAALPAGIICFLIYLRALSCEFIGWDDTEFVVTNAAKQHSYSQGYCSEYIRSGSSRFERMC